MNSTRSTADSVAERDKLANYRDLVAMGYGFRSSARQEDGRYRFEEWPGKSCAWGSIAVAALLTAVAASPNPTEINFSLPG